MRIDAVSSIFLKFLYIVQIMFFSLSGVKIVHRAPDQEVGYITSL